MRITSAKPLILLLGLSLLVSWPSSRRAFSQRTGQPNGRTLLRDRSTLIKEAQLGRMIGGVRLLAQTVVSDLNDDFNDLSRQANALNRQRFLFARDMPAGFGMKRWSPEEFTRRVDEAYQAATDLIDGYKRLIPCVEISIGEDGPAVTSKPKSPRFITGRTEYLAVEITNRTGRPATVEVSGTVSGRPIRPVSAIAVPRLASYLLAGFTIDEPGKVDFLLECKSDGRTVPLDLSANVTKSHRLALEIVNADTKKSCAARAYIRGSDGRHAVAFDRPVILAGAQNVMKFGYADGRVEAILPPGKVRIRLEKGFEYLPAERTIDLAEDRTITMELTRWVDMPAEGWYSGDTHVHWVRHTWHENGDPNWLNVHSRAEDLWVNNNLILKHWWKNVTSDEFPGGLVANRPDIFPVGKVEHLSIGGRIVWTAEEYRNDEVFGHLCFLRIDRLIEPVSTGFMGGPEAVHFPPNSHTYDEVHEAGGIVIAAHDVVMEVPIQVILGKLDSLDAHNTNRYYDILNCGFRMPLSIGSDYPANLMGFARVYVYCGETLDYDTWVDNLAAGKTFVSSGAVIEFEAGGRSIGDIIELVPGQEREISVRGYALAKNPLDRVEIVHNGRVILQIEAESGAKRIDYDEQIRVKGPGWLAARVYPPNSRTWWGQPDVAHTSPIYLRSGDDRLIKADAVQRLIQVLQNGKSRAAESEMYTNDAQKREVLDYYDSGIHLFEQLLE